MRLPRAPELAQANFLPHPRTYSLERRLDANHFEGGFAFPRDCFALSRVGPSATASPPHAACKGAKNGLTSGAGQLLLTLCP